MKKFVSIIGISACVMYALVILFLAEDMSTAVWGGGSDRDHVELLDTHPIDWGRFFFDIVPPFIILSIVLAYCICLPRKSSPWIADSHILTIALAIVYFLILASFIPFYFEYSTLNCAQNGEHYLGTGSLLWFCAVYFTYLLGLLLTAIAIMFYIIKKLILHFPKRTNEIL